MATTPNLGLTLPTVGGDSDAWGGIVNTLADGFDAEYAVTARGDADYTILTTDRVIQLTTTFTAARTFTLPAASSFKASQPIIIIDPAGAVGSTDTLTLARAGSDTIEANNASGATSYTITEARQTIILRSDGVSKWIVSSPPYQTGTWTPTVTFATPGTSSTSYSTQTGRWLQVGPWVYAEVSLSFTPTLGTASGNLLIQTLPVAASDSTSHSGVVATLNGFNYTSGAFVTCRTSGTGTIVLLQTTAGAGSSSTAVLTTANVNSGATQSVTLSIWYHI